MMVSMHKLLRVVAMAVLVPSLASAQRMSRSPTHIDYPYLHENFTVLFQGDAITGGGRQRVDADMNHMMGQDYAYIVSAEIGASIPDRNVKFINRGVGGDRITDLALRWKDDTLALKPDVLSILIGINDVFGTKGVLTAEEFEAAYDKLLAETVAALPGTKIILGEPFLLPAGKHLPTYAADMVELKKRQATVAKLAAKYHAAVVHYQQAFDDATTKAPAERWAADGVHPTTIGQGLMAKEWLRTLNAAWANN
jgi:lysophospholipase L1-like esterase